LSPVIDSGRALCFSTPVNTVATFTPVNERSAIKASDSRVWRSSTVNVRNLADLLPTRHLVQRLDDLLVAPTFAWQLAASWPAAASLPTPRFTCVAR
jgi:hypothetical protein